MLSHKDKTSGTTFEVFILDYTNYFRFRNQTVHTNFLSKIIRQKIVVAN